MASVGIYALVFWLSYKAFLVPMFGYFGLGHREELPAWWLLVVIVCIAIPASWMPVKFERPSQFAFAIQFFVIYIPVLFISFHSVRPALAVLDSLSLCATALCSMTLIQAWLVFVPRIRCPIPRFSSATFWALFIVGLAVCLGSLLAVLGSNFRLVSLAEIYNVRSDAGERVAEGSAFAAYAFNWLLAFFLPFAFTWGFSQRRRSWCAFAIVGYIILFGVWGSKTALLGPIMLAMILVLVYRPPQRVLALMPLGMCVLLIVPAFMPESSLIMELVRGYYIQIVHERTFTASPLIIVQYLSFFETQPHTYGSHITGVSQFVQNPYTSDIPRMIGTYIYGGPMTANCNFWGMDGIAGFGLLGMIIFSPVYASVLWLLDSVSADLDPRFVTGAMGLIATNLADTSVFTTIVSGGLLLLIVAMLFFPASLRARVQVVSGNSKP